MTTPSRLSHAVLSSYDKETLLNWYCETLNGTIVWDLPYFGIMTFDDEHHRIGVMQKQGDKEDRRGAGLQHLAFAFSDVRELLTHFGMLKSAGTKPAYCTNHGITLSLYYQDPDGNHVELFTDLCGAAAATEFMKTPAFMANPGGVPIDPDELFAKMEAGASDEELTFYDAERNLAEGARIREQQLKGT